MEQKARKRVFFERRTWGPVSTRQCGRDSLSLSSRSPTPPNPLIILPYETRIASDPLAVFYGMPRYIRSIISPTIKALTQFLTEMIRCILQLGKAAADADQTTTLHALQACTAGFFIFSLPLNLGVSSSAWGVELRERRRPLCSLHLVQSSALPPTRTQLAPILQVLA